MALFTSKREKLLWLATLMTVTAIYATLGLAGSLARKLGNSELGTGLFVTGCLLILIAVITQGLSTRPGKLELGLALGIAAAYLLVFTRMTIPAERTHLIEYGVVALFIFEALRERKHQGKPVRASALWAILATAVIGAGDECIQLYLPSRVFDPIDMLFNTLAAVMAIGASLVLHWAQQRYHRK